MKAHKTEIKFKPKDCDELIQTIGLLISPGYGCGCNYEVNLNVIDVSLIENFNYLFGEKHVIYYKDTDGTLLKKFIDFRRFNGIMDEWDTKNGKYFTNTFAGSYFKKHELRWDFSQAVDLEGFMKNAKYNKGICINNKNPLKRLNCAFCDSKIKKVKINKIDQNTIIRNAFSLTNLCEKNIELDFSFLKDFKDINEFHDYCEKITVFNHDSRINALNIPFLGDWIKRFLNKKKYPCFDFFGLTEDDFFYLEFGLAKRSEYDVDYKLKRLSFLSWCVWVLKENEKSEIENQKMVQHSYIYLTRFFNYICENENKLKRLLSNTKNMVFFKDLMKLKIFEEEYKHILTNLGIDNEIQNIDLAKLNNKNQILI